VAGEVRRCPRTHSQARRSRDHGSVSSLPSSNRACGFPAPGFPTSFIGPLSTSPLVFAARYSARWSCCAALMVELAFRHSPALTPFSHTDEVRPLPSGTVLLSAPSPVLWAAPTPAPLSSISSGHDLDDSALPGPRWAAPRQGIVLGRRRVSPVPTLALSPFHVPYAAGFVGAAVPSSSHLPWPSPYKAGLGSQLSFSGRVFDAADFALCCGLVRCTLPRRA
jgi:hypothetical protein